ncbi:hypothetical protein OG693_39515 (plasmid) [Streptomyces sp. NBC_01259]|uniref:hypothetical protein n=1 Tax=Streptomyces sp. NBC_01259 TaxID=2903800 RepID=UPI002F90EC5F
MSTDSFHLAPAQSPAGATITAPTPTPAPDKNTPKKTKKPTTPDTPTDGSLAGVVIPGAALTALISLCWLTHQFGLPAVIAGVIACALAASAALAVKARRATQSVRNARKSAARNSHGAGGGGGSGAGGRKQKGPRHSAGGGSHGLSRNTGSKTPRGSRTPGLGSGRTGAGTTGGGSAAMKPKGLNAPKNTLNKPKTNNGTSNLGGDRSGGKNQLPKQTRRNSPGSPLGPGGATKNGGRSTRNGGGGNGSGKSAADGRLGRIRNRKTPTPDLKSHKNAPKQDTPTRPLSKTEKKQNRAMTDAARRNGAAVASLVKDSVKEAKKRKAEEGPRRHRRVKDRLRKTRGKVKQIKKHQENKAKLKTARSDLWNLRKLRIKNGAARIRKAARPVTRRASRTAAFVWRFGTQAFNKAHMMLGSVRYSDIGPSWFRPIAKLMHAVTSPVARLIHATGSWNWVNQWMYRNTTPQHEPKLKPVSPEAVAAAVARNNNPHQPFTSPNATAPKGTPPMSSDISGAMPLVYAADAVRTAGLMLLINPSDNMHGYEATIRQLSDVQSAISQVIQAAAESTRENFAVNPIISDAYDDTAGYGYSLAERLDAIPVLFRMVHAEQMENLDNPTPQAAKWDISQNTQD